MGRAAPRGRRALTGAATPVVAGSAATTCSDWTGVGTHRSGDPHFVGGRAFSAGSYACGGSGVVYCLQE